MNLNQLLITTNLDGRVLSRLPEDLDDGQGITILPIGFTGATYKKNNAHYFSELIHAYELIDLSDIYPDIQKKSRKFCLDFKYEFPRKPLSRGASLFDLFDQRGFNLWWFTGLSEMGSFRTPFVEDIYALSLIQEVLKKGYEHIIIDVTDAALRGVLLEYCTRNSLIFTIVENQPAKLKLRLKQKFLFWWILTLLVFIGSQFIKLMGFRLLRIGHVLSGSLPSLLFFSFFPSLWSKQTSGNFHNKIFSVILPEVQEKFPAHDLIFTVGLKQFVKTIVPQRKVFKKQGIVFLERYLNSRDILFLLTPDYLKSILKFRNKFRPEISERYGGFDISPLVKRAMDVSLFDPELYRDVMIYHALNNLVSRESVMGVVHPAEFQCYEKAIWFATKDKTKTYAFQHSAIGLNWLNYYFNETEIQIAANPPREGYNIPLPDTLITAGKYPHQVMLDNKFPVEKLFLCGALRYDHLAKYLKGKESKVVLRATYHIPVEEHILVIFTGVNESESYDMVGSAFEAMRSQTTKFKIFYKAHPLRVLDENIAKLHAKSGIENELHILPVQANYFEYISLADATLFCNSTIGIESIALGTPAISFDNYHSISSYDIIEVGNAVFHVNNAQRLSLALKSILTEDSHLSSAKKLWPKAIEDTFYKLDGRSNERFLDIIDQGVAGRQG